MENLTRSLRIQTAKIFLVIIPKSRFWVNLPQFLPWNNAWIHWWSQTLSRGVPPRDEAFSCWNPCWGILIPEGWACGILPWFLCHLPGNLGVLQRDNLGNSTQSQTGMGLGCSRSHGALLIPRVSPRATVSCSRIIPTPEISWIPAFATSDPSKQWESSTGSIFGS